MEALLHDLRYAARQMLRQPVFATVAVVTLAIGKRVVRGEPARPRTFAGVALGLSAATFTASYLPARRAARVDPIIALRRG